jgi:hypothetical protein
MLSSRGCSWIPCFAQSGVARSDGRPVVLLPGFLAGDGTLAVMGRWLRRLGYRRMSAGSSPTSTAPTERSSASGAASTRSISVMARVALIGHSRGGHFARDGSAGAGRVSHAISLGADLRGLIGISAPTLAAVAAVRRGLVLTRRTRADRCFTAECTCGFARDYARSFPSDQVRLTSIYSRQDGVVRWQGAVVPEANASR